MSNGRRFRRGGTVWIGLGDDAQADEDDCPFCRAMGQRIEDDGSIVNLDGATIDMGEAVRIVASGLDWEWGE